MADESLIKADKDYTEILDRELPVIEKLSKVIIIFFECDKIPLEMVNQTC